MTCFGIGLFMSLMLGFIKLLGSVGLYIFLNQFRKTFGPHFFEIFPITPLLSLFLGTPDVCRICAHMSSHGSLIPGFLFLLRFTFVFDSVCGYVFKFTNLSFCSV